MVTGKGLLTPLQKTFLGLFAEIPDQDQFFLTGGTALTEYYFGHRLSFDLDLFTGQASLILPTSYLVEERCRVHQLRVTVTQRFASYVEFVVEQDQSSLKVDLALDSPFRFEAPVPSEYGVYVNNFLDAKVDKLLAYYGRAEPRDAIDLYFVLLNEPLRPLLDLAAQKDPGFDLYWMAVALKRASVFPDEIERWPVSMLLPCDPVQLKLKFEELAANLMDQVAQQ